MPTTPITDSVVLPQWRPHPVDHLVEYPQADADHDQRADVELDRSDMYSLSHACGPG